MRMIVFDVETGGLDPQTCALLSIGAVDLMTKETFYIEIQAEGKLAVHPQALKINGFTMTGVRSPLLPNEDTAIWKLNEWLSPRVPFMPAGQNISFDLAFLNAAIARHKATSFFGHRSFDLQTLALSCHLVNLIHLPELPGHLPSSSLDSILGSIGLSRTDEVHSAREDALLTAEAIEILLGRMSRKHREGKSRGRSVPQVEIGMRIVS